MPFGPPKRVEGRESDRKAFMIGQGREALSPGQAGALERIEAAAGGVKADGGRVVFVAGETGSGRSHLLDRAAPALERRMPDARVISAAPFGARRRGAASDDPRIATLEALGGKALTIGAALVSPAAAVVAALLDLGLSVQRSAQDLGSETETQDPEELMDGMLRAAAGSGEGPLICLVDEADWLGQQWWFNLRFLFAEEIRRDHPLLLVLAVDGPVKLSDEPTEGESTLHSTARSLCDRGLAEWLALAPMSVEEASQWLGPAKRPLVATATEISGGRPGELAALWRSWQERDVIERDDEGRWAPGGSSQRMATDYVRGLTRRLSQLLGSDEPDRTEVARVLLAWAAVQGRTFTAEPIADALEWDREKVVDLLDLLVVEDQPERGVLEELEAVAVRDLELEATHHLCRYRFRRVSDWRAALAQAGDEKERARLAASTVEALRAAYEPDLHAIAHTLATLSRSAGDVEAAAHFELAALGAERTVMRALARHLLTASTEGWSIWDFRDAARRLTVACASLALADPPSEVIPFAERAQQLARYANPIARGVEADAYCKEGFLRSLSGEFETAKRRLETARKLASGGAPYVSAAALRQLGEVEEDLGADPAVAAEMVEEAMEIFRREGHRKDEAGCMLDLSAFAKEAGDWDKAHDLALGALRRAEALEEDGLAGAALHFLGVLQEMAGNLERAEELGTAALALKRQRGEGRDVGTCLRFLAGVRAVSGRLDEAWHEATEALEIQRRYENPTGAAECQVVRATVAAERGEADTARSCLEDAARLYAAVGQHDRAAVMAADAKQI